MPIVLRHRHRRRCWGSKTPSATTVLAVSLLLTILLLQLFTVTANEEDYYCGRDWNDATQNCALPCPSGEDHECASALGNDYGCYIYTGCEAQVEAGDFGFPPTKAPSAIPLYSPSGKFLLTFCCCVLLLRFGGSEGWYFIHEFDILKLLRGGGEY